MFEPLLQAEAIPDSSAVRLVCNGPVIWSFSDELVHSQ